MFKKIVHNFFIYAGGAIFVKALSAILMPFTLAFLSTSEFGLLSIINNFISILSILVGMGLRQVFWIEYFHCKKEDIKKMINNLIFLYLVISLPVFIVFIFRWHDINEHVFFNNASQYLILCALANVFFSFFNEFFYQAIKYQQNARLYTFLQIFSSALIIIFALFLIIYLNLGVLGFVLANLVSLVCITSIAFYFYVKKNLQTQFSLPEITQVKEYLKTGISFIPSMIFAWVIASSDRFILAKFTTLSDVGIYSLADSFGQLYYLIILQPLSGSYLPDLFEKFAKTNDMFEIEKSNKKIMYFSMAFMFCLIIFGYGILQILLNFVLPSKFGAATNYIMFILLGYVFLMGSYFTTALIQFKKHKLFLSLSFCFPAILNVVLNWILVPHFKIYGCVISTFISYVIYFFITLFYNLHIMRTDFSFNNDAKQLRTKLS